MPFSLSNAQARCLRYIAKILAEKLNIVIIIHFNLILIYTKNWAHSYFNVLQ